MEQKLKRLADRIEGEIFTDSTHLILYATDASAYREMPTAVCIPKSFEDVKQVIAFASKEGLPVIPRAAGTSLAGQVVGNGIVVDISRNFREILEVNTGEHWVRVQPGVVRDELNMAMKAHGLFFGPETSTSNRCMVGGMVGNNSCGSRSVIYGSTRDHLIAVKAILSDGSEVEFKSLTNEEFEAKCKGEDVVSPLEAAIYQNIKRILSDKENQERIRKEYPKESIVRRNTGYALDLLLNTAPFTAGKEAFNFCKLIAGSEGTLAFITEAKLNLVPTMPEALGLACLHFNTVDEALRANLVALKYNPSACELMDHYILECTKNNIEYRQHRFFVQGDPGAILVVEFARETKEEVEQLCAEMIAELKGEQLGYHFPVIFGEDTGKIWHLRKAGLGLLSNMPGDPKPVPVIEDTAVDVADLPDYIRDFNEILKKYDLYSVHYAHAGSGELHLRPIINLKTVEGNTLFRTIAEEIAVLVKKYKGSLSGEHGDGRLRGEFIRYMIGDRNYSLLKEVKATWDPSNIFNPGKIVDTPSMNTSLRFAPGQETRKIETVLSFKGSKGILRAAEQCNGSGDCRKTHQIGGTMCPSYMATLNEKDTTRGRANVLREMLTTSTKDNPFDHQEIYDAMDLCLSCKGCKSECPSNVDIAKLKIEFLQHYHEANGIPLRTRLIANFTKLNKIASVMPWAYNFIFKSKALTRIANTVIGFAPERSMPLLHKITLRSYYKKYKKENFGVKDFKGDLGKVYLFCDEFTDFNDTEIGIKTLKLLTRLGYDVIIPEHLESGRTYLSKGLAKAAKKIAVRNIELLKTIGRDGNAIIGLEPSAILTLRDEYLDLANEDQLVDAKKIADSAFLIDEFLANEMDKGRINKSQFKADKKLIKLHGHCHQKSLSSLVYTKKLLSLPENYEVHLIPSGCCGMAGSFGYEKEHYEVSMKIGELVLFPTVRKQPEEVIIAAPGTSCRHQIKDGTGRKSLHPAEILYEALA